MPDFLVPTAPPAHVRGPRMNTFHPAFNIHEESLRGLKTPAFGSTVYRTNAPSRLGFVCNACGLVNGLGGKKSRQKGGDQKCRNRLGSHCSAPVHELIGHHRGCSEKALPRKFAWGHDEKAGAGHMHHSLFRTVTLITLHKKGGESNVCMRGPDPGSPH